MPTTTPIARSPLADRHERAGATLAEADGWQTATQYPPGATAGSSSSANRLVDRSYLATYEINGPETSTALAALCSQDVPLRKIHSADGRDIYRLTPTRAIVFIAGATAGLSSSANEAIDVTGGWATISLIGPDAEHILNKLTAVDLRERTVPVNGCCQGPLFGVNTLFGRFADRFDLHVCTDSAEFFWDVLLDAGTEFGL
jgi:sarcosine oxidase gamma subunit